MELESSSRMTSSKDVELDFMSDNLASPQMGQSSFLRWRPREANGFFVYKRRKRSNSGSHSAVVSSNVGEDDVPRGNAEITTEIEDNLRAPRFENDISKNRPLDPLLGLSVSEDVRGQDNNFNRVCGGKKKKTSSKITKRDHKMHKLVFADGGLPDGTYVAYCSKGKKLREGYKMGSGIICLCCGIMNSPSQFEAHAGWASRRKPYMNISTSNEVSLHEFAISLLKEGKCSTKDHDQLCTICETCGNLVLCDGCPRAFHEECVRLSSIRHGKWYCTDCRKKFNRNVNANETGKVSGVDSIKDIKSRCIWNVKNQEEYELIACILCRGSDYTTSGFGPLTAILCDQCEKEYHVGCLKKYERDDLKELPKGKWFCSQHCKRVYSTLQETLKVKAIKIPNSSLDILKKKHVEDSMAADIYHDVKWRLLYGKSTSKETKILLSQAVTLFHDCFDPIVDPKTGCDLIEAMIYGKNIRGQDFSGMYCAILTVNSSIVSAGILRIFGQEIAELPLAATCIDCQGKGYFQILYDRIEKLLADLNVETFVLPATDKAQSIWTNKFGFKKIPDEKLLDYKETNWQIINFNGTSLLEKIVPKFVL